MDKLEYIPGDLVMTNGVPLGTAQNVVYRVTSSDPSKTLKLDDGTVLKGVVCLNNEGAEFGEKGYLSGDCCAWVKDIVPIPLTPKILEKDGFEVRYSGRYCTKSINCRCGFLQRYIAIERKNNDWAVFIKYKSISDYALLCHIKYVHQLQNLLFFGLNINNEMEV